MHAQADLVKDGGHAYFIKYLEAPANDPGVSAASRAQAAFVLAAICDGHARGRALCAEAGLLGKLLQLLARQVRARARARACAISSLQWWFDLACRFSSSSMQSCAWLHVLHRLVLCGVHWLHW
jgi:hypothetical protein